MGFTALDLDVTQSCNLRCRYCYKAHERKGARRLIAMPLVAVDRALVWFFGQAPADAEELSINFMGAEPTLVPSVLEHAMRRARELQPPAVDVAFGAATNGTGVCCSPVIRGLVRDGLRLNFSIDGCREAHDACRVYADGRGSHEAAMRGARQYASLRKPFARATVHPRNVGWLAKSTEYLRAEFGSFALEPDYNARWTRAALSAFDIQFHQVASNWVLGISTGRPFYCSLIEKAVKRLAKLERGDDVCGAGRGLVAVDAAGVLYPCHRFVGFPFERIGTIERGADPDRLRPYGEYRARFDARPADLGDCSECEAVYVCKGACPAVCFAASGSLRTPPAAFCRIQRIVARQAIRALYLLTHDPDTRPRWNAYVQGEPAAPFDCC